MKNWIFTLALMLTFTGYSQGTVPSWKTIKLTGNTIDNDAYKVVVKSENNELNQINKIDLQDVFQYTTASALPAVGVYHKIYITSDNNKIYRWNGTFYSEMSVTDISNKVDKVEGKGLSTEDFTTEEKEKLEAIEGSNTGDKTLQELVYENGVVIDETESWKQLEVKGSEIKIIDGFSGNNTRITPDEIVAYDIDNGTNYNVATGINQTGLFVQKLGAGLVTLTANGRTEANDLELRLPNKTGVQVLATESYVADSINNISGIDPSSINQNSNNLFVTEAEKSTWNTKQDALGFTPININEKAVANGVATLGVDGKVPNSQIPALAISETFPVTSEASMLSLSGADQGDVAVRLDISKSFILTQSPATTLGNWQELLTPTDAVSSVNGKVGAVTLTKADVNLGNADNTSDLNKPVSVATQTALNLKANTTDVIKGSGTQYTLPIFGAGGKTLLNSPFKTSSSGAPQIYGYLSLRSQNIDSWDLGINFLNISESTIGSLGSDVFTTTRGNASEMSLKGNTSLNLIAGTTKSIVITPTVVSFNTGITMPTPITSTAGTYSLLTYNNSTGRVEKIGDTRPYKVYTALLTQSGTSAPVATVLENTLGGTVVWTRTGTGIYLGTLIGAFTLDKTLVGIMGIGTLVQYTAAMSAYKDNVNGVRVSTTLTGTHTDGMMTNVPVEIRVYN